jgi:two-component system, cell cycle sensor histidine kinase and response regulator CckA
VSSPLVGHPSRRYEALFQRVGVGIAIATPDGRLIEANPAFCALLGYGEDELTGGDLTSLTHPNDRARFSTLVAELLEGRRQRAVVEKRYVHKARDPVWVRVDVSVLRDQADPQILLTAEDLSAQRHKEGRLEESLGLLRIAGEVGRVGGWAIDTDPVKLYWSDEIHDLAGYPRGRTPSLEEALQLYPDGDRETMTAAVEACIADGEPFDVELNFQPRQGDPMWVRVVGHPQLAADGTVERIQGAIMDVSERQRAKREKDLLAERLRVTMESITDALYTVDRQWRFTYLNERAQEVLERDATELLGQSIWTTFPDAIGSPLHEGFERAVSEQTTVVLDEYHYPPLDRYFDVNVYPSPQGLAVYFRDVTERYQLRAQSEHREARLAQQAALLDQAQDAIFVRDLDGCVSYWNRAAEQIYGWTAEEASGRRVDELLGVDPQISQQASERMLTGEQWVDEVTKTAKDGRQVVVESRWTLMREEDGQSSSVLCIDTDVTQRRQMERQFLRAQRLESVGRLAGGIAHDLNNSLAPIATSVELLRSEETDPFKLRMLEIIATSTQHGAEVVSQVLSFARGMDGRREPTSVGDIIEEVRRIVGDTFPKDIAVEADVPSDLWSVVGDSTQIQQILINLCVNARDAMPDGGVLTLAASNGAGGASVQESDDPHVTLVVSDTGIGVTDEVMERMFEPFFSTKPQGEGTGLGLPTSAVIVQSHGGRIAVTSEVGAGTTFEVHLPADPASIGTPGQPETSLTHGNGELVLVVDDEPGIREVSRMTLERFGYRVVVASDGEEAIATFAAHDGQVAAVVTDLMMPVMDGFAVIEALRTRASGVPVIATSGLNTAQAAERSIAAGARRFLAKPYDATALLRLLREVLSTVPSPPD